MKTGPNGKSRMNCDFHLKAGPAILACLFAAALPAQAQTWIETSTNTADDWYDVVASADGTKLAATLLSADPASAEGIYLSTNSGVTWVQSQAPAGSWAPIACSADGTNLVAANANGTIYTSTNSGATWVERTTPAGKWTQLASSADGSKLIAITSPGYPLVSTNFGVDWFTPTNLSRAWSSVVCSANGNNMALQYSGDDADPWVSTNCGVTWEPATTPINQGGGLATSASGNILFLLSRGFMNTSTNWGQTWTSSGGAQIPGYATMVSSADGSTLLTFGQAENPALLWVSTDFGTTWTSGGPTNNNWTAVASSADGKMLAAVSEFGGIWVSQTPPSPRLNLSCVSNIFSLSWIVPSTNMVLEESPDLENWMILTNAPSLDDTDLQEQLSLPAGPGAGFFRLLSQ